MAPGSSSPARQPQPLAEPMSTRLEKSKFRYPVEHGAAFVELRDDTMSGEKVFVALRWTECCFRQAKSSMDRVRFATAALALGLALLSFAAALYAKQTQSNIHTHDTVCSRIVSTRRHVILTS